MQRLEVSCAVGHIYMSLGAKGLINNITVAHIDRTLHLFSVHIKNIRRLQITFLKSPAQPFSLINFPGWKVAGSIPHGVIGIFH